MIMTIYKTVRYKDIFTDKFTTYHLHDDVHIINYIIDKHFFKQVFKSTGVRKRKINHIIVSSKLDMAIANCPNFISCVKEYDDKKVKVGYILGVGIWIDTTRDDNRIDIFYSNALMRELKLKLLSSKDVKYVDRIYVEGKLLRLLNLRY